MDPNNTNDYARRKLSSWIDAFPLPRASDSPQKRRPSKDLLGNPKFSTSIDFSSQEGFYEAAKKKKGASKQSLPPPPPPVPPPPPAEEPNPNDGAGGDSNGGDGAGSAGNGNGNDDGDGWSGAGKPKKKKDKGELEAGLPSIPTTDFGTDAFQDIKLGDDTGGKLDLGLGELETEHACTWFTS